MDACPACGGSSLPGGDFCTRCGRLLPRAAPRALPPETFQVPGAAPLRLGGRPLGVVLLAAVCGVGGALAVPSALVSLTLVALPEAARDEIFATAGVQVALDTLVFSALSVVALGSGALLSAWGLWKRRRWAFHVVLATLAANALLSLPVLPGGSILSFAGALALAGLVGFYLQRPAVRDYLGRAAPAPREPAGP